MGPGPRDGTAQKAVEMSEPTISPVSAGADALSNAFSGSSDAAPVDSTPVAPVETPASTPVETPAPQGGGHPAWQDILNAVPTALHESLRPQLQKWDEGVQKKLQEVHSQYEPYKNFVGADPQQIEAGLRLYNILATNPQAVFDQLVAQGFGKAPNAEQGQSADEEFDLGGDPYKDPRVDQIAQQQQQLMAQLEQAQAAQEQAKAEAWLDSKISAVSESFKTRGIDPDMDFILTKAMGLAQSGNMDYDRAFDAAVASYEQVLQKFGGARTAVNNAPTVVSPTGTVPSSQFDPGSLSGEERRNLATDMLRKAFGS